MATKEDFELEKLKLEIAQLKAPFWKKANIMISAITIIVTALIGFSSYFVTLNKENLARIQELEKKNEENKSLIQEMKVQSLSLQKTQIEIQAAENKKSYEQSVLRLRELQKGIDLKSKELTSVKSDLQNAKIKYEGYKQKVRTVVERMAAYGSGYAQEVLQSQTGKAEIKRIAELPDEAGRCSETEKFTMNIVNQTITKYVNKKEAELDLILE